MATLRSLRYNVSANIAATLESRNMKMASTRRTAASKYAPVSRFRKLLVIPSRFKVTIVANAIEGDRQLRILTAHIAAAAQAASAIGAAIERFAEAMRAPLSRGRAGGIARAKTAWRYTDGTFVSDSAKIYAYQAEYERYAAGGFAT